MEDLLTHHRDAVRRALLRQRFAQHLVTDTALLSITRPWQHAWGPFSSSDPAVVPVGVPMEEHDEQQEDDMESTTPPQPEAQDQQDDPWVFPFGWQHRTSPPERVSTR